MDAIILALVGTVALVCLGVWHLVAERWRELWR